MMMRMGLGLGRREGETKGIEGLKFAILKTDPFPARGPGTQKAMAKAVQLLKNHGAVVEEIDIPYPEFHTFLVTWHRTIMATDGRVSFLPEYRTSKDLLSDFLIGHVENRANYTHRQRLEALDGIATLRPKIDSIFGQYDALLTPSVPDEAPVGIESTGSAAFNSAWTALHVPVVNIPGFQGDNGLPVGVSLVAPTYRDRTLLRVCGRLGRIFEAEGGWKTKV